MLEIGFIKLHRKMTKWGWYQNANTFRLFVHLLLTVNYESRVFEGKTIDRGQRVVSVATLSDELKISARSIRTALNHLKSTNELTIETAGKTSIITIINYDFYQQATNELTNDRQTSDKQATNDRQTSDKRPTNDRQTTDNNERKIKKDKERKRKIKKEKEKDSCAPGEPAADVFIELPLNDNTLFPVTRSDVEHYKELYQAVNVEQELRGMLGWLESNPRQRKTSSGIKSFITRWLKKTQDQGGKGYVSKPAPQIREPERRSFNVGELDEIDTLDWFNPDEPLNKIEPPLEPPQLVEMITLPPEPPKISEPQRQVEDVSEYEEEIRRLRFEIESARKNGVSSAVYEAIRESRIKEIEKKIAAVAGEQ